MKEFLLRPVRIEAGLGNPPDQYTNNDTESANFLIKHSLNYDTQKPHEFIEKIQAVVETQFRNEDRAVFGKGPYTVRKDFTHLAIDDRQWGQMTNNQRMSQIRKFRNAGIDDAKSQLPEVNENECGASGNSEETKLSLTAVDSGINSIPIAILQTMFDKATNLLQQPGLVISQPGATNGAYIVAGNNNKVYCVTPGKGGSLKCDQACIHHRTKVCLQPT